MVDLPAQVPGLASDLMRYSVVLFDLDGTVIDSGAIILASMRHAVTEVLGRDPGDELLMAAVDGPGLEAQMRELAPDRVRARIPPTCDNLPSGRGQPSYSAGIRYGEGRR